MNCQQLQGWLAVASCVGVLCSSVVRGATEPAHEREAPHPTRARVQLSVPEKNWLGPELYSKEPGNYEVLIWGHADNARAMPEKFDVTEEIRHLAQHHIDFYTVGTPRTDKERDKYRSWFESTGLKVGIGFPRTDTVQQALKDGARPSNPTEVAQGKAPKVAWIDPHYVAASVHVAEQDLAAKINLDWVRAVHFQDEPSGEIPSYDLSSKADIPLAREWDKQVRGSFGLGKWGIPTSNWDTNVPQSRLAYEKFWAKEFNRYQRTMAQALRAQHPRLTIWSANFWFNLGSDLLFDYGEMGEFLDAVVVDSYATQQEIGVPGRGRWNAGYVTKLVGDLSHRPVYNHVQILEYHGATPTPEDIREYVSQVLRTGGRGIVYYAVDMPQYKYIRYTDPARWATMMEIGDQLHTLPRLRMPEQLTTGVWVSQETLATTGPRVKDTAPYVAYVLLGETVGTPFRYLSDWGVERKGASEFAGLKILYVTHARWVPAGVRESLVHWVQEGGVLVLTATDSFTLQIDGTTFPSWKEALGVSGKPAQRDGLEEWPCGKGRILVLQDDLWSMGAWDNAARVRQVRELQAQYRGGMDEPIWRFRLPVVPAPTRAEGPAKQPN